MYSKVGAPNFSDSSSCFKFYPKFLPALLEKPDKKKKEKLKDTSSKDEDVEMDTDKEESKSEADKSGEKIVDDEAKKEKEENLFKVIRYLVAAGCDVNFPVSCAGCATV